LEKIGKHCYKALTETFK